MSRAHAPKLRALRALQARTGQQLSAAGQARLWRHLANCGECREAQLGLRIADRLVADLRATEPALDYAAIQARLERGQPPRRVLRLLYWLAPALTAAAAALFMLRPVAPPKAPPPPSTARLPAPVPPPAAERLVEAYVTAVAGQAWLERAGEPRTRLGVDASLREGDAMHAGPSSLVHVRLADDTAYLLGADSSLRALRLRQAETRLALDAGSLISRVHPLAPQSSYVIEAAGHAVSVRGTHFEVSRVAERLAVHVAEGHVVVQDATGRVVADLHDRERWGSVDAAVTAADARLASPRSLGLPLGDWPLVNLLDLGSLARFGVTGLELDHSRAPAGGGLAMRVPRGEVVLIAERGGSTPLRTTLQVPPEGLALAPEALQRLLSLRPRASSPRPELAFEQVMAVVHAGTPALQRCYERALRLWPELDARLTIRVSIASSGRVSGVSPLGQTHRLPRELISCMRNVSSQWRFASVREPVAFDIPLRLQPR